MHAPLADRVAFVADLAARLGDACGASPRRRTRARLRPLGLSGRGRAHRLRRRPRHAGERRRDRARSCARPATTSRDCDAASLIAALSEGPLEPVLTLADYETALAATPSAFREAIDAAWGDPAADPACVDGAFRFRFVRLGRLVVAVQPDRGDAASRKGDYHDLTLPPRHGYVAFHFWLTRKERIDALIQLGAHGTLEWLPGKAVALTESCAPEVLLGPTPVVYPFIVNNPGEAAQAKRRIGAVTVGHLTPPLIAAGSHGAALELEGLFDEYAEAQSLDPRRARAIAALILERAARHGPASRNAPPRRRRRRRRSPRSTPGSATSRTCASATACMCSAARRTAPHGFASERG